MSAGSWRPVKSPRHSVHALFRSKSSRYAASGVTICKSASKPSHYRSIRMTGLFGMTGRKPGAWDWILGYLRMRYQLRTGITSSNETLVRGITVRHLSRKRNSDGYSVPWIVRVVFPTRLIIMIMARSAGDESTGSDLRGTCVLQACITSCAARTLRTEDMLIMRPRTVCVRMVTFSLRRT